MEVECTFVGDVKNDTEAGVTVNVIFDLEITLIRGVAVGSDNKMSFNNDNSVTAKVLPGSLGTACDGLLDYCVQVGVKFAMKRNQGATVAHLDLDAADWPTANSAWGWGTVYTTINDGGEGGELLHGARRVPIDGKSVQKLFDGNDDKVQNPCADPNWYYYYSDALGNNLHTYKAATNYGKTLCFVTAPLVTTTIGSNGNDDSPRFQGVTALSTFGNILEHEMFHRQHFFHNHAAHGDCSVLDDPNDPDGDIVCSGGHAGDYEATYGTNPDNLTTFGETPDMNGSSNLR